MGDEEGGGGEDVNLEEPEELPEDAAEEGEAAAAAPTADSKTLLEMFPDNILAVNAVLEVTVDGDEYLEKPIDMCFFRPGITFAVEPAAGPASGGTPVSLLVDGVLFDGSEAKVKFDAATDGGLPGGLDVDAEASVSTDGVQSTIQCTTGALSEALDELAALANPAPVEAAEDEEEEEGAFSYRLWGQFVGTNFGRQSWHRRHLATRYTHNDRNNRIGISLRHGRFV